MADYINRDILKKKIEEVMAEPNYQHTDEDWLVGLCLATDIIDEMPTVKEIKE